MNILDYSHYPSTESHYESWSNIEKHRLIVKMEDGFHVYTDNLHGKTLFDTLESAIAYLEIME